MNGAIFYTGKYGSTAQYAGWIAEATGFPVFDAKETSVIVHRLTLREWVRRHRKTIEQRPTVWTKRIFRVGPVLESIARITREPH